MITDYIKKELEDKIFMVEMLEQRDKATDVDIAMKQRYLRQLEEMKSKPFGAVWDYYCLKANVPVAQDYIPEVTNYEDKVLSLRK